MNVGMSLLIDVMSRMSSLGMFSRGWCASILIVSGVLLSSPSSLSVSVSPSLSLLSLSLSAVSLSCYILQ